MNNHLIALFIVLVIGGCSSNDQSSKTTFKGHVLVEFCDIPKTQGKEVFTRAVYSGSMEYWSLSSPSKCKTGYKVDLDFKDEYAQIPEKFKEVFNHSQSFKHIIIEAVGVFEKGRKGGYGHLGSNNARFLVSELVDVKGVKF